MLLVGAEFRRRFDGREVGSSMAIGGRNEALVSGRLEWTNGSRRDWDWMKSFRPAKAPTGGRFRSQRLRSTILSASKGVRGCPR